MTGPIPPKFSIVLVASLLVTGLIALAPAAQAQAERPVPPGSIPSAAPAQPAAAAKSTAAKTTAKTTKPKPQAAKPRTATSATAARPAAVKPTAAAKPVTTAKPKPVAAAAPARTATVAAPPKPAAPATVAAPAPAAAPPPVLAQAASPARPGNVGQAGRVPVPVVPNTRNVTRPGGTTAFDGTQRELVQKVSGYLSGIQTLVGNFVQVGPDGSRTTGDFYMQKPGRVRFEYDAPAQISLISDGQSVAVRDRRLATQDVIPLSQTPLRFLLAERIDLMRDAQVVAVHADDVFVTVVIEEKSTFAGTHRLMLMFGAKDFALRQWTVTDPQGYDTTVAVYNLDASKRPDPSLFKIDYTRYQ